MALKILLTNDDGYDAPGLIAMKEVAQSWGECFISAPEKQSSAAGHSVTLHGRIRVKKRFEKKKLVGFAIKGTPADCVKFALQEHYKKRLPDLVISGINPGPNTGVSVYYSGTIAAAREALFAHIPAFAVSVTAHLKKGFDPYAKTALKVIRKTYKTLKNDQLFYNINIPEKPTPAKGVRITHQSHSRFEERFLPVGKRSAFHKHYVLRGEIELLKKTGLSDEEAVRSGFVSLTPCQLDVSAYSELERLQKAFS